MSLMTAFNQKLKSNLELAWHLCVPFIGHVDIVRLVASSVSLHSLATSRDPTARRRRLLTETFQL